MSWWNFGKTVSPSSSIELRQVKEELVVALDTCEALKQQVDSLNLSLALVDREKSNRIHRVSQALIGAVIRNGKKIVLDTATVQMLQQTEEIYVNIKNKDDGTVEIFVTQSDEDGDDFDADANLDSLLDQYEDIDESDERLSGG